MLRLPIGGMPTRDRKSGPGAPPFRPLARAVGVLRLRRTTNFAEKVSAHAPRASAPTGRGEKTGRSPACWTPRNRLALRVSFCTCCRAPRFTTQSLWRMQIPVSAFLALFVGVQPREARALSLSASSVILRRRSTRCGETRWRCPSVRCCGGQWPCTC